MQLKSACNVESGSYMAGKIKMKERKWSDFIHTSSSLLIFIFNKRGLGRIPQKKKGFNQDQTDLAHLLAN